MIKLRKTRIKGLAYLLLHPRQIKQITLRELRFSQRNHNRRKWIEWQEYDGRRHIQFMETYPVELNNNVLHLERTKTILDMIARLDSGLAVLDVGCGNGAICTPIRKNGNNVTCVELKGVAPLTRHCGVYPVIGGDAENLAFSSESFDLVLASEVAEHLWNPQNFFNEAHRVLKTDGHLIISTPEGKMGLCYDAHKHYFTEEILMQMLGKKFKLCQAKHLKANRGPVPTLILLLSKSTKN